MKITIENRVLTTYYNVNIMNVTRISNTLMIISLYAIITTTNVD